MWLRSFVLQLATYMFSISCVWIHHRTTSANASLWGWRSCQFSILWHGHQLSAVQAFCGKNVSFLYKWVKMINKSDSHMCAVSCVLNLNRLMQIKGGKKHMQLSIGPNLCYPFFPFSPRQQTYFELGHPMLHMHAAIKLVWHENWSKNTKTDFNVKTNSMEIRRWHGSRQKVPSWMAGTVAGDKTNPMIIIYSRRIHLQLLHSHAETHSFKNARIHTHAHTSIDYGVIWIP